MVSLSVTSHYTEPFPGDRDSPVPCLPQMYGCVSESPDSLSHSRCLLPIHCCVRLHAFTKRPDVVVVPACLPPTNGAAVQTRNDDEARGNHMFTTRTRACRRCPILALSLVPLSHLLRRCIWVAHRMATQEPRKTGGVVTEIRFFARPLCAAIRESASLAYSLAVGGCASFRFRLGPPFQHERTSECSGRRKECKFSVYGHGKFPFSYTNTSARGRRVCWESNGRWFRTLVHGDRRPSVGATRTGCVLLGLQIVACCDFRLLMAERGFSLFVRRLVRAVRSLSRVAVGRLSHNLY